MASNVTSSSAGSSPKPSSVEARRRMRAVRQRGTKPEVLLETELVRLGLPFTTQARPLEDLRRRADFLFLDARVAVFVDGCFWHRCPEHASDPKTNSEWWSVKLARNVERDRETDRRLRRAGWGVVRIWEHEGMEEAALRIKRAVHRRSSWKAGRPRRD
jgi:DNA mismatch endonuclease, patch repair protein